MPAVKVTIEGANEVVRALRKVPKDTQTAMKREAKDIATSLTDWIRAAGRAHSRQGARAASGVREGNQGFWPVISGSPTGRARGVLFGSVFGMKRHSGWYAHKRYLGSRGSQFGPYVGYPGYWFFSTAEQHQPWVAAEWSKAAADVVHEWSA